jgi:hypothetical protein
MKLDLADNICKHVIKSTAQECFDID